MTGFAAGRFGAGCFEKEGEIMFKKLIRLIPIVGLTNMLTDPAFAKTPAEQRNEIQFPQ